MLGPLGGDRLWNPKELDKCKAAAQELVNAQDKGDDLEFKSTEEIAAFDANGQVKNTYVVYKQA